VTTGSERALALIQSGPRLDDPRQHAEHMHAFVMAGGPAVLAWIDYRSELLGRALLRDEWRRIQRERDAIEEAYLSYRFGARREVFDPDRLHDEIANGDRDRFGRLVDR
jgi:hypothetical protein